MHRQGVVHIRIETFAMPTATIVLTGSNPTLMQQLARFITQSGVFDAQVYEHTDLEAVVVPMTLSPIVLIAVLRIPAEEDLEAIRCFHARYPHVPILAVSPLDAAAYQVAAFAVGASAILADHELVDALIPTIVSLAGCEE